MHGFQPSGEMETSLVFSNRNKIGLPYGIDTKASKNPTISPIPMFCPGRSSSLDSFRSERPRARAYGQAVSCVEGSTTSKSPLETIPRNCHRKRSIDGFQFNHRISYRNVFAVTCGLANRLCRRFIIYAILPKILCL
jgi:hypothetical protein